MSIPSKRAVMFVLDASLSMDEPFHSTSSHKNHNPDTSSLPPSSTATTTTSNIRQQDINHLSNDQSTSIKKLSYAKKVIEEMTCDLMLQSKTHEVGILVVPTETTSHHMACPEQKSDGTVPFSNMTELEYETTGMALAPPSVDLLRCLRTISSSTKKISSAISSENRMTHGFDEDFMGGILVAADALFQRTNGKRYQREIILFTDAQSKTHFITDLDVQMIGMVVQGLRSLDCRLTVIGLNFYETLDFCDPSPKVDNDTKLQMEQKQSKQIAQNIQSENEKFLQSLVKLIGGSILATSVNPHTSKTSTYYNLAYIPKLLLSNAHKHNHHIDPHNHQDEDDKMNSTIKSVKKKINFIIAPHLEIKAQCSLLLSKANLPSLKWEYKLPVLDTEDDDEKEMEDEHHKSNSPPPTEKQEGENTHERKKPKLSTHVKTSDIEHITTHWDITDPLEKKEVDYMNRTTAYRFGSDLIPLDPFDMEGLKYRSPVSLTILYYTSQESIPMRLFIGSPYAITAEEEVEVAFSKQPKTSSTPTFTSTPTRARATISALAQAMETLERAAICTFVKSKDANPLLGALFPWKNPHFFDKLQHPAESLFWIQLPFANDLLNLTMPSLQIVIQSLTHQENQVCDDLIDSLMLPSSFQSDHILNPTLKCLNEQLLERAINARHIIDANSLQGVENSNCSNEKKENDSVVSDARVWNNDYTKGVLDMKRVKRSCDIFRSTFPLDIIEDDVVIGNNKLDGNDGKKKRYWGDS